MNKRIISTLLAIAMTFSAFVIMLPIKAAAADEPAIPTYILSTNSALEQKYSDALEKIENDPYMSLYLTCAGYRLYCNPYTGEVIYLNMATGQALSTNPYNLPDATENVKAQLLSQIIVKYNSTDGMPQEMNSFTDAAQRGQIIVKNIKNGIRVQYTIGRENTNMLLPRWIMAEDFEEIRAPFREYVNTILEQYGPTDPVYVDAAWQLGKLEGFYTEQDPNKYPELREKYEYRNVVGWQTVGEDGTYPIMYTLSESATDKITDPEKKLLESYIITYAPEYGYDDLEEDHAATGYVEEEEIAPVFKMAIEYTIDQTDGTLNIRLPANSIRFDEATFTLDNISLLNYFGAANMENDGYVFYPDGSGTLFDFSELYNNDEKIKLFWSGKVYGQDFAYYEITGQGRSAIRTPVYGIVGTDTYRVMDTQTGISTLYKENRGYFAILEEGEALSDITVETGATSHQYASVYTSYYPRAKDSYVIPGTSETEGTADKWTVVSDRKYTDSYRTKIIMLTDEAIGNKLVSEGVLDSYYNAKSWTGMALAYRDYLEKKGIITRKTNSDVKAQMPLYIESFGTIETMDQILSMPVTVDTPLTTFDDIITMYDDLAKEGVTNVNFKLTGFANGGMIAKYPAKLKWQKTAGGDKGFENLISYATEKGFGVYPDFDFLYIAEQGRFDGISLKTLGAKTVDDRYTSKRIYDAVYQIFDSYFELCAATNRIMPIYEKFAAKYSKYNPIGISVGTLASDLNSNFDKDNPTNRNDSMENVVELFAKIEEDFGSVMSEGGNMYAVKYLDHLLDVPLDASNYRYESASVPFLGMILHGYVDFAGAPINESGNTDYNILKAIENGSSLYYLLSYRNSVLMKQDGRWSQYYSIRFDIWFDEMVEQYKAINEAIGDLQTSVIIDHQFIKGERVPDSLEVAANDVKLSQAIYEAVAKALDKARDDKLGEFRQDLVLYQKLKRENSTLKALKNAQLDAYLAENFAEYSQEKRAEIAVAYSKGGDCEQFKIETGLKVGVLPKLDEIYASIESFTGRKLTEDQINEIYVVIADKISVLDIEDTVLSIINDKRIKAERISLTREKLYQIDKLIVDGASYEELNSSLGEIINDDIKEELFVDEQTISEIAALLADAVFHGDEDVFVDTVDIDYDFNKTSSMATDGDEYVYTAYTLDDERLVMVTYSDATSTSDKENRVSFILNYNIFDVVVNIDGEIYEIPSYGYERIVAKEVE